MGFRQNSADQHPDNVAAVLQGVVAPAAQPDRLARSEQQLKAGEEDLSNLSYDALHRCLAHVFPLYDLVTALHGIPGLKVLRHGRTVMHPDYPVQHGKQITLYFGSYERINSFKDQIIEFFSQLAQALFDLNIVPEVRSPADKAFPSPYLTMSY
jgi:hypothetical protein